MTTEDINTTVGKTKFYQGEGMTDPQFRTANLQTPPVPP
jgi:hypothetical protein